MFERWRLVEADAKHVEELSAALTVPEEIARILVNRGFSDAVQARRFLDKSLDEMVNPLKIRGMQEAADRLAKAVEVKEPVIIHGDFDADGVTSCALLTMVIREFGGESFPFIPNRLVEGHGISLRSIELAKEHGAKLLITCDCGTSSEEEVCALQNEGIETIITDHHQLPERLPKGAVLVNPQQEDEAGCEELSGVGVAFMLAAATRFRLRERGYFSEREEPNLKSYLDIVALGTLADLAPLTEQNRILVSKGLQELAQSNRPGILAMREVAGLSSTDPTDAQIVGFGFAPRINAAARLGHADEALALLMSSDSVDAQKRANSLETWNQERKAMQERMTRIASAQAQEQIEKGKKSIVVFSEEFHSGIVGLVAQKLCEKFGVPSFVFALEGPLAKGSGRSRAGVNVIVAMRGLHELLSQYGGHKEAGGCVLEATKMSQFQEGFEAQVRAQGFDAARELLIDAELKIGQLSSAFISALTELKPFGVGNPEPVFSAQVKVLGRPREVGRNHLRAVVSGAEGGPSFSAIGFGLWGSVGSRMRGQVQIAFTPEENEWNGRREIQVRLKDVRSV